MGAFGISLKNTRRIRELEPFGAFRYGRHEDQTVSRDQVAPKAIEIVLDGKQGMRRGG